MSSYPVKSKNKYINITYFFPADRLEYMTGTLKYDQLIPLPSAKAEKIIKIVPTAKVD